MKTDQLREHFDDPTRADRARNIDRQAFAGELIDDRQALQLLPPCGKLSNGGKFFCLNLLRLHLR